MATPQATETAYRYRWVILGVLWSSFIIVYLNRLSIGPMAPFLKEDLGLNSTQIGTIVSSFAFGFLITQLPAGWLVDRTGARWPMALGAAGAGAAMLALFFTSSYASMLALMFIAGLSSGFLMPSTTQGVIIWFPKRERATVMGLKQTSVNLGGIITAIILPPLALTLGFRYGFLLLGITSLLIGIASLILYKEPPDPASFGGIRGSGGTSMKEIIRNRDIWLLAFAGFCLSWTQFTAMAHLVLYLTERLLFPVVAAGGMLALAEAAGAIARPGSGLLSDRVFNGRRKPVFMIMAIAASAVCLVLALFGPYLSWMIYPVLFLFGIGGIGFGGIFFTLISEFGGRQGAGKAMGLSGTISISGSMLGPTVFGRIVDVSGSYEWAWLSLAFLSGLCIVVLLFVREERKKI